MLTRVYGPHKKLLLNEIKLEISNLIQELDVEITKLDTERSGHIKVILEGEDEEFVENILSQKYGLVPKVQDIHPESVFRGQLIDVDKVGYGLYVDIGIKRYRKMDALVPLFKIRNQFNMQNRPLRTITNAFVLVEKLPVEIKIIDFDTNHNKIEAEFTSSFQDRINSWINDDHERLLVMGTTKAILDNALSESGHTVDIYEIEKLGQFEYSLRCKRSTRASGILAAIGPKLKGIPMYIFIPKEVEAKTNAKT